MTCEDPRVVVVEAPDATVELVSAALRERQPRVTVTRGSFERAHDAALVLYDAPAHGDVGSDNVLAFTQRNRAPLAVFTSHPTVDSALDAFRAGACGYLSAAAQPTQISNDVSHLLAGRTVIDTTIGGELARAVAHAPLMTWPGITAGLTRREGDVLKLLQRGLTNREIADQLIIGMQTVKTHAHTIYRKMGVGSRSDLFV